MRIGWRTVLVFAFLQYGQPLPSQSAFTDLAAKADAARDSDRLDEASALYHQALTLRPAWVEGWWSLGTIAYDRNAYQDAAFAFEKVAALDPKAGTARIMLGLCEFELGREESALQHLREGERIGVVQNQQLRNVALYHEGVLLQRQGKFHEAQETLDSLCMAGVGDGAMEGTLGMAALRVRDKHPPQGVGAEVAQRVGHAECLAGQKKFDKARQIYGEVVRDFPEFPNIHYAFGRFLLEARDTDAGVTELEQEIARNPGDAIARLEIAAARYKINSTAGLPYAEAAVKLDPDSPFAHYLLGLLLLDTDNYLRAIPELEIAQRAMTREPRVYSALGSAYSRAGRESDAARARAAFLRWNAEAPTGRAPGP